MNEIELPRGFDTGKKRRVADSPISEQRSKSAALQAEPAKLYHVASLDLIQEALKSLEFGKMELGEKSIEQITTVIETSLNKHSKFFLLFPHV